MPLLIDDTGEVLKEIQDGFLIIEKSKYGKYRRKFDFGRFIKVNPIAMQDIYFEIHYDLFWLLIGLSSGGGDGYIRHNNRRIERKQLIRLSKYSVSQFGRAMKELLDLDIVHKVRTNGGIYYIMNPWLCFKGKNVDDWLLDEFKNSRWREYAIKYNKLEDDEL